MTYLRPVFSPGGRSWGSLARWLAYLAACLLGFAMLSPPPAQAGTTVLAPNCFQIMNPDTGSPESGGKIQVYVAGTTTPTPAYTDSTGTVALANPAIADGSGVVCMWLNPAIAVKLVVKKSDDTVIRTIDGISTVAAGAFTTISATGNITTSGQLISTVSTGTAPLSVTSTTVVTNLNVDQVDGGDFGSPPVGLGSTVRTPGNSQVTNLDVSGTTTLSGAVSLNGSTTMATAKTFNGTDADSIKVNSIPLPTSQTVPFYLFGTMVDTHMWVAPRAGEVVSVKEIHSVVGGAACAVRPRKITDTSAPGAAAGATVKEITTAAFDCTATVNTTLTGTLSATQSDYQFAAGDKISLDVSGTMTALVGILVLEWKAR